MKKKRLGFLVRDVKENGFIKLDQTRTSYLATVWDIKDASCISIEELNDVILKLNIPIEILEVTPKIEYASVSKEEMVEYLRRHSRIVESILVELKKD